MVSAIEYLPTQLSLPTIAEAMQSCEGCALYRRATQAVPGEGRQGARVMLVGEQPGDEEDRSGRPFVGPAGRLLEQCLTRAGIDRRDVYLTNAVKHFKWTERGKRRMHTRPNRGEAIACRPWLELEVGLVRPEILVLLGATAAQSMLGAAVRVTKQRGKPFESPWAPWTMVTVHPSSLLRIPDEIERRAARAAFVVELAKVAARLGELDRRDHVQPSP